MTFTSLTFLLFFPLVFFLYWRKPEQRWQNGILVLASYFFYGWWDYRFCALMMLSSLVDYFIGIAVHETEDNRKRRSYLFFSLFANLGLLGYFKYYNFFSDSLGTFLSQFGWTVHPVIAEVILPVGISFYTFQTLSYTIDIYRGKLEPTRNLIDYLAFVSFFPQLVAGPIERATNLIPQFAVKREFSGTEAADGCRQILWGFFKKLVIADRLAVSVDAAYNSPNDASELSLLIATVFFAFQIYCDFSAYSDIAIGTAKMFRIDLMRNFAYPYFSQSVTEFWRRWHISLSTWFRDYVFIPLGGSRCSTSRVCFNLMLTFVLSGLWHGADWKFIVWGAINGAALVAEKLCMVQRPVSDVPGGESRLPSSSVMLRMVYTFTIICVGWVFFRAASSTDACLILYKMIQFPVALTNPEAWSISSHMTNGLLGLLVLVLIEWAQRRHPHPIVMSDCSTTVRWTAYTIIVWSTLGLMLTDRLNPFIYFTF